MTTFAHVYLQRSASFKNIKTLKIGRNETIFTLTALIFIQGQLSVIFLFVVGNYCNFRGLDAYYGAIFFGWLI